MRVKPWGRPLVCMYGSRWREQRPWAGNSMAWTGVNFSALPLAHDVKPTQTYLEHSGKESNELRWSLLHSGCIYMPLGRSTEHKISLVLIIRVEWCICFLSILKQKSSLSIFNSIISLGKAFVYFSACKIPQNKSMGNWKPHVIRRTSITSSASSLPMFHKFTLLKAGR